MTNLETKNSKFAPQSRKETGSVRDFTDLEVWRLAHELRKLSYSLMCGFPTEER